MIKKIFSTLSWNFIASLGFFAALFFVFTNGIPLIQSGWMEELSSKSRYVNTMRISVILFFVLLLLIRWVGRDQFHRIWFVRLWMSLGKRSFGAILAGLFLAYISILVPVVWMRHAALETRAFDLGIFAQAVWNTLQGDFLYSSIKGGICLLGDHFSPIVAALAPFYKIWPDPRMLLIVQVVATASCLFAVGYIAREKTGSDRIALIFAIAYFFFLPSRNALHEDFHPEVLVEPFIFLSFIFLDRKKILMFLVSLLIVVSGKENMFAVSFVLGLYAFFFVRKRFLGTFVMILSAALFIVSVRWLIPLLSGSPYLYEGFYTHLGNSPIDWVKAVIHGDSLEYVLKLFAPTMFLSFFHFPTFLMTWPILGQNLLSNNDVMRSFGYHYTAGLTPFLFISAIHGFQFLCRRFTGFDQNKHRLIGLLLFLSLVRSGPSEYYYYWQSSQHASEHRTYIAQRLAQIPSELSVLTHNNFIPQLVNRREVYQFNYNDVPTKTEQADEYQADVVIFDEIFWEPGTHLVMQEISDLMKAGYFLREQKDGFYVMTKSFHIDIGN